MKCSCHVSDGWMPPRICTPCSFHWFAQDRAAAQGLPVETPSKNADGIQDEARPNLC